MRIRLNCSMVKLLAAPFALALAVTLVQPSSAKTVSLLDGRLSLDVPNDFSAANPPKPNANYSTVMSLKSQDQRLLLSVTYGVHKQNSTDLKAFLQQKLTRYSRLAKKHIHFHWLSHGLVTRDGRDWVEVSFTHDVSTPVGTDVYTRSISTFCEGRLLEIWVLTRAAQDTAQRATVDKIIESVKLRS